ncbi:MAG TPA: cupredoxin domain-containing protein [Candidatus Thermoplasmatota archaeon]|nr:cupredoxin domain-containing protein [Candidatus Thermoplasmatota archaeon]
MDAADEKALRLPAALTGVFVVGLLLGVGGGALLARAPASPPPVDTSALETEVAALNATVAALKTQLAKAQSEAEVAANQAGATEVATRFGELEGLLAGGRKTEAFVPLKALITAAQHTPWAPLLNTSVRPVRENATQLLEIMMFGNDSDVGGALERLKAAHAGFDEDMRVLFLPFHGASPAGVRVVLLANMTGFFQVEAEGRATRSPTLRVPPGAKMLIEVTNSDALIHNLVIRDLFLGTRLFGPGETVGLVVGPASAGDYRYFCDVPGHEATMNGHVVVGGAL